jgi:hypothetical protein
MVEMTLSARRRRDDQSRLLLAASIVAAVAFCFAAKSAIGLLQAARCPAGTFLWGSTPWSLAFQLIPLFAVGGGLGWLTIRRVAHVMAMRRRPVAPAVAQRAEARHLRSQSLPARITTIMAVVALPLVGAASLSQFCLAGTAVAYQPRPWMSLERYSWDDVAAITASCRRSRGGCNPSYVITLRDGKSFDIMTWPRAALKVYSQMSDALRGRSFTFDSSAVCRRRVSAQQAQMLTQRP